MLAQFGILWTIFASPAAAMLRDLFLYVYGRFDDPPRPACFVPIDPFPAPEAPAVEAPRAQSAEAPSIT